MASTITAGNATNGLAIASDITGILQLKTGTGAGTTALTLDTSQNLQFNSGYGSVATAYGCRAWVNFNGTGTVAIRASGNVSSITDNGTGDYTVNFTTAMPDANFSIAGSGLVTEDGLFLTQTRNVGSVGIRFYNNGATTPKDNSAICVSIFR